MQNIETFREWLAKDNLVESFDRNANHRRLSNKLLEEYWMKILNTNDSDLIKNVYILYPMMKCYEFKNLGREYFIYSYIKNSILEIHFYDMGELDFDKATSDLNKTKNPINVFSAIVDITLKEIEERPSRKILIVSPIGREKLYESIINKILDKYQIQKNVKKIGIQNQSNVKYGYLIESSEI